MHSNFITPPDYIENILIIDATEEQIADCAEQCRDSNNAYNVYFYHARMNELEWLDKIKSKADVILVNAESTLSVTPTEYFGSGQNLENPKDFFNK